MVGLVVGVVEPVEVCVVVVVGVVVGEVTMHPTSLGLFYTRTMHEAHASCYFVAGAAIDHA